LTYFLRNYPGIALKGRRIIARKPSTLFPASSLRFIVPILQNVFNSSDPDNTDCVSFTKINQLMLFREIIAVYAENNMGQYKYNVGARGTVFGARGEDVLLCYKG
jgi:hypothetical protein